MNCFLSTLTNPSLSALFTKTTNHAYKFQLEKVPPQNKTHCVEISPLQIPPKIGMSGRQIHTNQRAIGGYTKKTTQQWSVFHARLNAMWRGLQTTAKRLVSSWKAYRNQATYVFIHLFTYFYKYSTADNSSRGSVRICGTQLVTHTSWLAPLGI